jgi:NitT/TauT family transport system permease protein
VNDPGATRDVEIHEDHESDVLTAFEGDVPSGTRTPSALAHRLRHVGPAVAAFFIIVALWEAVTRLFDIESFILPKPSEIVVKFFSDASIIWAAGLNTLYEALGGLVIGTVLGVLVALATVRWVRVREGLMPFAIAANSVPIIALAPITNAMFGLTSPVSKMAVVAVVVFFPVMINTARGLIEVDVRELELMRSYAASPRTVMRQVRVPHALPYFFSALKVSSALSLIAAIVAEYFGGPQDVLGQYILNRAFQLLFPEAWAAILVASILGIGFYVTILIAERLVMPWHVAFRSADDA